MPLRLANPVPAAADAGVMEWSWIDTPDIEGGKNLYSPITQAPPIPEGESEIIKLLAGDNATMYAIVSRDVPNPANTSKLWLFKSEDGGIGWGSDIYANLVLEITGASGANVVVWDIAIPRDNPYIIVAAVSLVTSISTQMVYISTDGGANWSNTQWPPVTPALPANSYISAMDVSLDYGGGRDVMVGTRNGTGLSNIVLWVMKVPGYGNWIEQNNAVGSVNPFTGDVIDAHFSPTYNGDSTILVLYSRPGGGPFPGTWLATGTHDIAKNTTAWQPQGAHIEIKNSTNPGGDSPYVNEIITGMLQMPSDFSGQSASLRRVYVCTDAISRGVGKPNRGVYRVDDTVVFTLMDNSTTFQTQASALPNRRAATIAYWGTYASGKLLVGERLGHTCTASVPVWFTDSPTVCPVPCWYPAKKPPTGAAGHYDSWEVCSPNFNGYGNAYVVWSPTFASQGVAYADYRSHELRWCICCYRDAID